MNMRSFLAVGLVAAMASQAFAVERPARIRGARALGMGDAHTAVADDHNVFFYNPAGSVQRTAAQITLLDLPVIIGDDFRDAYDFVKDNEDELTDFNALTPQRQAELINEIDRTISKMRPKIAIGAPNISVVTGPMGKWHWGTGLFGQVEGGFRVRSTLPPSVDYDLNADAIIPLNIARRFELKGGGMLGMGANLKYLRRYQMKDERVTFVELEDFEMPPEQKGSGFGADLGWLYQPNDRWSYGLAVTDVLGTKIDFEDSPAEDGFEAKAARTGTIKPRWNTGLAWVPERIGFWPGKGFPTRRRLLLAFDIKDFANADDKVFFGDGKVLADTAWTHVHLGAEYRWWFLRFRGGANQGYPTFGLGLDIPFLKIDYTYFSDELGRLAGTTQQINHMASLSLRFGTGGTQARDRVKNSKAPKTVEAAPKAAEPVALAAPPAEAAPAAVEPVAEAPAPVVEPAAAEQTAAPAVEAVPVPVEEE